MSYALDSKKRKFERILESLTDSSPVPSPVPKSRNNVSSRVSSQSTTNSKRRRVTPDVIPGIKEPSTTSLATHYLPTSREAFLRRLETFRSVTKWHIPSTTSINAAEWCKRGWICEDTDTVSCPTCRQQVFVDLEFQSKVDSGEGAVESEIEEDDPLLLANEVYAALVERYRTMIVDAHSEACLWRKRGCDASIQRVEGLLNVRNVMTGLSARYRTMETALHQMPVVAALPNVESQGEYEHKLGTLQLPEINSVSKDCLTLALAGWSLKEDDVVECRHCFRSLGLWLYRGDQPTLEQLDAVDSHLEYCPWRSADAQDTEIHISGEKTNEKLPAWLLVFQAVVQPHRNRTYLAQATQDATRQPTDLSPEQRQKRMKELMRRIRDLRRPFNVKALLKRTEKRAVS